VDGIDDTLTESCEGAVNFMVIEIRVGSLQELPSGGVVVEVSGWIGVRDKMRSRPKGGQVGSTISGWGYFVFINGKKRDGWMDQLRLGNRCPTL
jgi:hypothetical protein